MGHETGREENGGAWWKLDSNIDIFKPKMAASGRVKLAKSVNAAKTKGVVLIIPVSYADCLLALLFVGPAFCLGWEDTMHKGRTKIRMMLV